MDATKCDMEPMDLRVCAARRTLKGLAGWPMSRLDELLPDAWAKKMPREAASSDQAAPIAATS
jgi:hypothetical protein